MIRILMTCVAIYVAAAGNIYAADNHLLGDWAGLRSVMEQKGVTAEAVLTTDFLYNTHGGVKKDGTILGNMDLTFKVDTAKAGWWQKGSLFFYFLGNVGSNPPMTEIVGDVQTSSNIEATHAVKLYEAWYEHRFINDRVSILAGLHDFNSEFDALEYVSLFLNSSFRMTIQLC